jgi:hypothetical protein
VTEVADNARLPRTTAYRILETLRTGGYVIRDEIDDRYRPTMAVKGLADGVEDEAWLREHAWPVMQALCKKLLWPIGLTTLKSGQMILRAATDRMSPQRMRRGLSVGAVSGRRRGNPRRRRRLGLYPGWRAGRSRRSPSARRRLARSVCGPGRMHARHRAHRWRGAALCGAEPALHQIRDAGAAGARRTRPRPESGRRRDHDGA